MNRVQKIKQLRAIVRSIVYCRDMLDSQMNGLTSEARGNIERRLTGYEKAQRYLEDKIQHV